MLSFSQENSNGSSSAMSDAYKFLFKGNEPRKSAASDLKNFKEYSKLIKNNMYQDTFVDNSLLTAIKDQAPQLGRKVSTAYEGNSAYNFSFQDGLDSEGSEFYQNQSEMVLDNPHKLSDVFEEEIMKQPEEDWKEEMNTWPAYQKDCNPCIVLEEKDTERFFQKECYYDNIFHNLPDESLEFENLRQSFESFAMPEIKGSPERGDESAWHLSVKTDDKESVQAKESHALKDKKEKPKKRKTKTNSFALGRTWFRGMSNYFKDKFEPILKQWEKDTSNPDREPMDLVIKKFIGSEFRTFGIQVDTDEFLDSMVTILHSQNYK